jgi:dihydrofolate reductase
MTDNPFGEKMNAMPKFVVSRTIEDPAWTNTTVLSGNLADEVGKLKEQFDGDILVAGSAQLVQGLIANDLVDQLDLMVFPVILGAGKRLFGDTDGTKSMKLVETKPAGETQILVYRRA